MIIDTEFNTGDKVCYLKDDKIYYTYISNIRIEWDNSSIKPFNMIYILGDGMHILRNNFPKWDKRIFKDKESLLKYLEK